MDTRVILIHCNESTVPRVRQALVDAEGYERWWDLVEVCNVSPMDAAFNRMLDLADRTFHVQVDADMCLHPNAIKWLHDHIQPHANLWQLHCPLWDTLFRRPISGVKIYRSEIARRFRYRPTRHCEADQIARARTSGFTIQGMGVASPREACEVLGDHIVPDARTAFWACLDRGMRRRWLVSHNRPDWFGWLTPYYRLFPAWWAETGDDRYLAGLAGLCAALSASIPEDWGEKDITRPPEAWALFETYLQQWSGTSSSQCAVPAWLAADWGMPCRVQ